MLIPLRVDVPLYRYPIANYVLIAAITVCFGVELANVMDHDFEAIAPYVLDGWGWRGLLGHMFLHAGFFHLIGNMLFLWIFGNAVCEKVGNIAYPFIFLGLGLAAAAAHNIFDGGPAIGASGAINGIVGMFLVWFPLNTISVFYFFWFFIVYMRYGVFELASFWMIGLWLIFDIIGAMMGMGGVAYSAHLGGFAVGFVLAAGLTMLEWVSIYDSEETILDILKLRKKTSQRAAEYAGKREAMKPAFAAAPARPATSTGKTYAEPRPLASDPIPYPFAGGRDIKPAAAPEPRAAPFAQFGPEISEFIKFPCPCGKILRAPIHKLGQRARCPACNEIVQIPENG